MHTGRRLRWLYVVGFTRQELLLMVLWSCCVLALDHWVSHFNLTIPWVPISVVGAAVAFFLGFKANASYDRMWEARKVWGAIVNDSRSFAIQIRDYLNNLKTTSSISDTEMAESKRTIIFRHIAWLYQLKRQLRTKRSWEHYAKRNEVARSWIAKEFPERDQREELLEHISEQEFERLSTKKNMATQLLAEQSREINQLKHKNALSEFNLFHLMNSLSKLYDSQGKCERIKNYPLPRQYASFSYYLTILFIVLVPFGILDFFKTHPTVRNDFIVILLSVLVGWTYWIMELVGDYAENPFEGLYPDIPMTNLTRTIEIDLKEMLDEKTIPAPIDPIRNYLM